MSDLERCCHQHRGPLATDGTGCPSCLGAEVERLRKSLRDQIDYPTGGYWRCRDAAEAAPDETLEQAILDLKHEVERLRKENEMLHEALGAMTMLDADGKPCYRTANNVPQQMPANVRRVVRRCMLSGDGSA